MKKVVNFGMRHLLECSYGHGKKTTSILPLKTVHTLIVIIYQPLSIIELTCHNLYVRLSLLFVFILVTMALVFFRLLNHCRTATSIIYIHVHLLPNQYFRFSI